MSESEAREIGFYWVLPDWDCDASDWDDNDPQGSVRRNNEHWSNQEQPAYWDGREWHIMGSEDWGVSWVGEKVRR